MQNIIYKTTGILHPIINIVLSYMQCVVIYTRNKVYVLSCDSLFLWAIHNRDIKITAFHIKDNKYIYPYIEGTIYTINENLEPTGSGRFPLHHIIKEKTLLIGDKFYTFQEEGLCILKKHGQNMPCNIRYGQLNGAILVWQNYVISIGGHTNEGYRGVSSSNSVYRPGIGTIFTDMKDDTNRAYDGARIERSQFGTLLFQDRIYITGGHNQMGIVINSVECFDCETKTWIQCNNLPDYRYNHSMVEYAGTMYIIGGSNHLIKLALSVLKYNSKDDTWIQLKDTALIYECIAAVV